MLRDIYELRDKKLKELGYGSYQDYLQSEEWKEIKRKIKKRNGRKWNFCNICGSPNNLDVHHSSYKVIGTTNPGNTVKLLCRDCHQATHDYSKLHPTYNLYKAVAHLRKERQKNGLPWFKYMPNGNC